MNKLIDTFGRVHNYLRISVTDRCNLRCVYCMPAEGIDLKPHSSILRFEEIERLVKIFAELGISKLRITGGEPLVRKDIPYLLNKLKNIKGIDSIGMTTNGLLLKKFVKDLKQAGLNGVNISLDTLQKEKFKRITLRENFEDVISGIDSALTENLLPLKLNVVVMGGINDDEILNFVEFVKDKNIILRFIEYMPFKSNGWSNAKYISYIHIKNIITSKYELIQLKEGDGVSKLYSIKEFVGKIGFISSISEHFCADCKRLRLTADGMLKTCLFYPAETNLRDIIRKGESDEEIKNVIQQTLSQKKYKHPEIEEILKTENNAMIEIGG